MRGQPMNAAQPYHLQQQNPRRRRLWQWATLMVVAMVLGALRQSTFHLWPTPSAGVSRHALAAYPQVMVWAWERPEVLDFIDPHAIGVAFLARTRRASHNS